MGIFYQYSLFVKLNITKNCLKELHKKKLDSPHYLHIIELYRKKSHFFCAAR